MALEVLVISPWLLQAQLEAEGHIAVQPSEFFHGEDSSASLLIIIIRNEDIAEHICEVIDELLNKMTGPLRWVIMN